MAYPIGNFLKGPMGCLEQLEYPQAAVAGITGLACRLPPRLSWQRSSAIAPKREALRSCLCDEGTPPPPRPFPYVHPGRTAVVPTK